MNRQTKYSSYRELSLLLETSKDVFEIQILSKILADYHKYHVHDFKSFEVLLEKDKEIKCPKCHSINIVKNGKIRMEHKDLYVRIVERILILQLIYFSSLRK